MDQDQFTTLIERLDQLLGAINALEERIRTTLDYPIRVEVVNKRPYSPG